MSDAAAKNSGSDSHSSDASAHASAPAQNRVIALATRRPVALLMISASIFVFGLLCLGRLPVDLMPEISYPSITVRTQYPGAAPEDVEDRVSRRLEQALSVVRNLRSIHSISKAESSDVVLEFAWDADLKTAVQDIREKIDQAMLPDDVESPQILRYDPRLDPVLQIGLVGDLDLRELRRFAEEEVERRLETVPGVAAVRVRGGREEEICVDVNEEAIRNRGLSIADIVLRLREENLDQASGLLKEGNVTYLVRTRNELASIEDIAAIPIRRDGDSVIRLSDVAQVRTSFKDEVIITRIASNDLTAELRDRSLPAVRIEVFREAGANIVELARSVRERLYGTAAEQQQHREWQSERERAYSTVLSPPANPPEASNAPTDTAAPSSQTVQKPGLKRANFIAAHLDSRLSLVVLSDQSTFIQAAIDDLIWTAIIGGVLAVAVLYLFLGKFTYTAMVTLAIPFSVVASFVPMFLGGITLNIMSLGGLALGVGMLVDAGIVVLEAIFRRRELGDTDAFSAAIVGASEVGGAVFASTLTTIAVFFPIVFVEGVAGQIFRDQSLTVVYSLTVSLIVSLTLIPMLLARTGENKTAALSAGAKTRWFWSPVFVLRWRHVFRRRTRTWRTVFGRLLGIVLTPYLIVAAVLELGAYVFAAVFLAAMFFFKGVFLRGGGFIGARFEWTFRFATRGLLWVESAYRQVLTSALEHRFLVLFLAVASIVGSVYLARGIDSELIPEVSQGEFQVLLRYPVGTGLQVSSERAARFEQEMARIPEISSVATTIGVDPEEITDSDLGEHTVRFRVRLKRGRESLAEVEQRVERQLQAIYGNEPDQTIEVTRPVLFSFKTPIEVEIRGHNLETLRAIALEVKQVLSELPELSNVQTSVARGSPEYHLFPDREKMARHDITTATLADVLREKNMGEIATRYRKLDRRIDVRVRLRTDDRDSIAKLLDIEVQKQRGGGLRLEDFVALSPREGPAEIRRVDQQRAALVSAELAGVNLGKVAERLERELLTRIALPADFNIEVVGQKREMERSRESLFGALLLAIFLVYVVMAAQFESLLQPFIILLTIPLAAIGVTGTLWVIDLPVSIMVFLGMIILAGIVVNNAIVLLDQVNRLREEGFTVADALLEGGRRRLRPILMTTLTTALGMLPMTGLLAQIPHEPWLDYVLGSGEGAEIRAPLAYTVIGGLTSSTVLTLVVIPVIYSLLIRGRATSVAGVRP
ncbi:MAG: efflux RND transporter permease subunit [Planctomycetota bacterium]